MLSFIACRSVRSAASGFAFSKPYRACRAALFARLIGRKASVQFISCGFAPRERVEMRTFFTFEIWNQASHFSMPIDAADAEPGEKNTPYPCRIAVVSFVKCAAGGAPQLPAYM